MIINNAALFFLLSCHALYASNAWHMPTTFDDYDPQQFTAAERPIEPKPEPKATMHTPSLQHVLKYITENYHGHNVTRPEPLPPTVNTPMRMQLSMEFSKLRASIIGVSYDPSEHAAISERSSLPLSASIAHDIDVIASGIFGEWIQAEQHIKQAKLLLNNTNLSLEERHHYRLKSLILGLQVLYKYRKLMLDTPEKQQQHHHKMLKLVFAARISFAISTPMQIPTQHWYVREEYRYKKIDDFEDIKKIYDKLNHKLCPKQTSDVGSGITFHIDDTTEMSQSMLQLPTQPIAIRRS
jgi:hypothetical protein